MWLDGRSRQVDWPAEVRLERFLDAHGAKLWIQFPDDDDHWYSVAAARCRIPPAHLDIDVLVTRAPGLDTGALWIDELATGYRWALTHDRPDPFRPHPCPWPPLAQRVG